MENFHRDYTSNKVVELGGGLKGEVLVRGPASWGPATVRDSSAGSAGIFVASELDFADYEQILRSQGVICEAGAIASHLAVICRILGIPVIRVPSAMSPFPCGSMVTIDPSHAVVYAGRVEHVSSSGDSLCAVYDEVERRQAALRGQHRRRALY